MTRSETQRPLLYLDIDGVLLRRTNCLGLGGSRLFQLATGALPFLTWATDHFEVFWLSARTADGDATKAERAFRQASSSFAYAPAFASMISDIPAAPWRDAKILGIDIGKNFIWIDDDPDPYSVRRLATKGLSGRLLRASSDEVPDVLVTLPARITSCLGEIQQAGIHPARRAGSLS
jgi:hypothetical protein